MNAFLKPFSPWIAVVLLICISACTAPPSETPLPTSTPAVTLTPYLTGVPELEATSTSSPALSPTSPPTPTATPFLYKIVEGDTLIGVAFRYGITLAELLAANPGIDPQFLRIGDELIIPLLENAGTAAALPTPVGSVLLVGTPPCYPAKDDSLWCFAMFENQGDQVVENVSAQISIYGPGGELLASKIGITPVNLLPMGEQIPVFVWFSGFGPSFRQAGANLTSAIPVQEDDPRYVSVDSEYRVILNGNSANITGDIQGIFSEARVNITAFGPDLQPVGVRVVVVKGEVENAFSTDVFSLGGEIESIQVLLEAYP